MLNIFIFNKTHHRGTESTENHGNDYSKAHNMSHVSLMSIGLFVKSQIYVPIHYKEKDLGGSLKLDLLVNDLIIVEEKAVEQMIPLFKAQLLLYLKLTGKPKGLLINFHCENIKEQLVSLVTGEFAKLSKE